jgi:hypothetical protein
MKINANNAVNAIGAYKAAEKIKARANVTAKKGVTNSDKVEFISEDTLKNTRNEIVGSIEKEVPVSRLEQLAKAYANENCPVDANITAAYILGGV